MLDFNNENTICLSLTMDRVQMLVEVIDGIIEMCNDDVEFFNDAPRILLDDKNKVIDSEVEATKLKNQISELECVKRYIKDPEIFNEPIWLTNIRNDRQFLTDDSRFKFPSVLLAIIDEGNSVTLKINSFKGGEATFMNLPKLLFNLFKNCEERQNKGVDKMENKRKVEDFAKSLKNMNETKMETKIDDMPEPDISFATEDDYKKLSEAWKSEDPCIIDTDESEKCDCGCGGSCGDDCCGGGCCQEKESKCKCCSNHEEPEEIATVTGFSSFGDIDDLEDDICVALDDIIENVEYLKNKLYTEGKCKECGKYILFHLSDPQLEILKLFGLTLPEDAEYCTCEKVETNKNKRVYDKIEVNESVEKALDWIDSKNQKTEKCYKLAREGELPITTKLTGEEANINTVNTLVENGVLVTEDQHNAALYDCTAIIEMMKKHATEIVDTVLDYEVEVNWATKEGVEVPTKSEEDLGFDVKAHFDEDEMVFKPFETKLVPTGLYTAVDANWGLIAKEKGSTGKLGMRCGAGVIDSGYRGEIFIAITNDNPHYLVITKDPITQPVMGKIVEHHPTNPNLAMEKEAMFYPYKKGICQLIVVRNPRVKSNVLSIEELQQIPSKRGTGKLGSTDNL